MNKKNNEYWEHRKAEMIHSQIARADVTFDEISKVYNHSRKHIEKSIKGIFNKFQAEYGLSKMEAEQVIKIMRAKNKKLIPALSLLPSTPKIKQTIEMLSSAAYVSRINRLQKLLDEIDNVQRYIARNELRKTTDLYKEVAKHAYYGSIHQIQTQTGIGFSFNELDEELVEKLLAVPWNNKNYKDRVWDNATELSNTLKDEVTQAVLTGKSEKLVIDEISNRFNVGEFKSKRLVRTETAYINNEMEALSYVEADIDKYRFVAVLDIRTSHICREHDHKIYEVSKRQAGVNFPPLHPFCRSTTIPVLDTDNLSELSRRARDPRTGKNIIIPGDMSYNEWYNQYVEPKWK
jgi:phage head morphogenesis protein, SPP1 gp7 family|nr:MAG TPA: minor capsid protein [Caudoviricetes sp.]